MAKSDQDQPQDKPKIIIDDDWKTQAAAEKQRLAEEVDKAHPAKPAVAAEGAGVSGPEGLPPASMTTLINQIAMQAMMALGGYEDPRTHRRLVDLDLAKFHIDTLKVLEAKTGGKLTEEESALLDKAMYECRMQYVQFAQRMSGIGAPGAGPGGPKGPA